MLFDWKAEVHVKGITPLLIHNGRMANPLDLFSKKMKTVTSKRKKTEEDIQEILRIQWEGSLYWDDKVGLHMPVENVMACIFKACKKHKLGQSVSGFVFDEAIGFPILTKNHDSLDGLKADPSNKFVKTVTVQRAKTLSCRPMFETWELKFDFFVDESIVTIDEVKTIISTMSQRIGLGVWTPSHPKPGNFGKFLIKSLIFKNLKSGEVKKYENKDI